MIKLIALDIDGTLVKRKNIVSKINIKAITEARKKGIKICIATGRNITRAKKVAKAIGIDVNQEYLISLNGGATFKYDENAKPILIEEHLFTLEDFKLIYDNAKENNLSSFSYAKDPNIAYVLKKDLFTYVLKKYSHRKLVKYDRNKIKDTSYKIVVYGKPKGISNLKEALKEKEFEMFSWSYVPHSSNIEINPKGVDKLYSLQNIAKKYNIKPEEIMYFGDSDNDKRAIEWVGQGIAMGNSKKHLKELAKDATKTNKRHGVGYWIKKEVLV
ncbi:Cof-type HAD-IIB family hydrolase [Spiroplasma diminutum]|uniref:HAD superfamily hydrolase n=1 Tax=Spiroplasma diminutum CUAS-1 TaxID=1276221 RepID=S5MDN6_9MOLU|nr:Cof-type HAD-IIB family hydrolase [Spiroplasma diminutum]AGR41833.1 HAD superfamily hydrolase [Spiroplasma diminutum CUAS-1]